MVTNCSCRIGGRSGKHHARGDHSIKREVHEGSEEEGVRGEETAAGEERGETEGGTQNTRTSKARLMIRTLIIEYSYHSSKL